MQSRAEIIDERFSKRVISGDLPKLISKFDELETGPSRHQLVDLFESQLMSRHLDFHSRRLQARGESFYTIGSAGHEGNAVCGSVFRHTDMAFLHYRSGAFMLQRSKQCPGQTPLYDMLLSFAASSDDPISGGRHKVLGSLSLNIPPQTSTIASHIPKAVGAAFSISLSNNPRVEVEPKLPRDSVVICNFGDASSNHSTAQGAINAAAWASYQGTPLPIVFVCEDNGIGISTSTPKGWIAANFSQRAGLKYLFCNGLDLIDSYMTMKQAEHIARDLKQPVFVHMKMVRLMGHAGSDAEIGYRTQEQINEAESLDPLLFSAGLLINREILTASNVLAMYDSVAERVKRIAEYAIRRPKLETIESVRASLAPIRHESNLPIPVKHSYFEELFSRDKSLLNKPQPMGRLINWTLKEQMGVLKNIVVCGEDVATKGGVYHVTHGLVQNFGSSRVINTLLDEQSILGLAIGLAHNGFLPIPEIQFLAYVHNAEDQIRGEAATLSFFSNGQFSNPMVIRIAGLGYQKGFGGHFHNDNSLAVFRDIPGVVIACPSNGKDASRMLRSCIKFAWEQKRVVIFVEPIALYMTRDLHEEGDGLWAHRFVPNFRGMPAPATNSAPATNKAGTNMIGANDEENIIEIGKVGAHIEKAVSSVGIKDKNIVIISYGNGYFLSRQAAKILCVQHQITVKTVDLRWLSEIEQAALIEEVRSYQNILVVDECRKTGSLSEELMTLFAEAKNIDPKCITATNIERITGHDCFVALGKAATLGMPSRNDIVTKSLSMVTKGN